MADAIPLLGNLQEVVVSEAKALVAVKDDIRGLQYRLMWLQAFLRHANRRRRDTSDELLRELLKQTRDVAFDAEDAIDDYYLKVDLSRSASWSQSIVRFFSGFTEQVSMRHNLSTKIAEINLRLEDIFNNKERYKIEAAPNDFPWKPSTNISEAKKMDDVQLSPIKQEQLEKKLEDAVFCNSKKRLVICVTGEGGVGKATLVRELYEKPTTKSKQFEQAWVSFPPYLSSSSILRLILMELEETDVWCPRAYAEDKLRKILDLNRFLLVIDGEVSNSDWNDILDVLPEAYNGSRIIRIMQGIHKRPPGIDEWIELECLNKERTSSLFKQTVCMEEEIEDELKDFDVVLHGITKGLPLAIVLLSGFIQTKEYPNEWKAVLEHLESKKSKRLDRMLAMCFDDLPHDLKSCFLYFAALPMNTPIEARKLVCMWMAEGFLKPKDGRTMEKVGRIYLKELIMRHLVKLVKTDNAGGGVEFVAVHHKVHAFLQHEAQEANFVDIHNGDDIPSLATTRRLSLQNCTDKYAAEFSSLPKLRSILSNFQLGDVEDEDEDDEESDEDDEEDSEEEGDMEAGQKVEGDGDGEVEEEGEEDENNEIVLCADNENNREEVEVLPLSNLLQCWVTTISGLLRFFEESSGLLRCCGIQDNPQERTNLYIKEILQVSKFLRVINLKGSEIGESLPATIGNVAHLQYLGVTACSLRYIPSTIGNLKHLQTLDVRNTYVYKLPDAFWSITTLRHVFGDGLFLPKQVGDLKHLQTLESIDPDLDNGWDSNTFQKMVHLQSLHVWDSDYNGVNAQALSALIDKAILLEHLDTLTLEVSNIPLGVFTRSSLRRLRTLVLEGKLNMERLKVSQQRFYFPNLSFLSLAKTEVSQDFINKLGKLPSLTTLILDEDSYSDDQNQLIFLYGGFRSLTKLVLSDVSILKLEIKKYALPELTDLVIVWYPEDIEIKVHGEREFVKKIEEKDEYLYGCITQVPIAPKKIGQLPA